MGSHERGPQAPTVEGLLAEKRMLQGLLDGGACKQGSGAASAHLAAVRATEGYRASDEQKRSIVASLYTILTVQGYVRAYARAVGAGMPAPERMFALYEGSIAACRRADAGTGGPSSPAGKAAVLEHLRASIQGALAPQARAPQVPAGGAMDAATPTPAPSTASAASPIDGGVAHQVGCTARQVQGLREGLKALQVHVQEGMRANAEGVHGLRAELKGLHASVEHTLDRHIRAARKEGRVRQEMQAFAARARRAPAAGTGGPLEAPVGEEEEEEGDGRGGGEEEEGGSCTTQGAIDEIMSRVHAFESARRRLKP